MARPEQIRRFVRAIRRIAGEFLEREIDSLELVTR
jgi:hypothetical protein